ncbi:unnamed protein product [Lupinus luteus]|uniref:Uncharacterized protein n=1 Tax=Lupinus luteus TaxID=3873 RepID=A0AAV1WAX6_LUPLU
MAVDDFWEEVVLSETVYDETDFDMSYLNVKQGEQLIIPKGLLLVAHKPRFVDTTPGPHIGGKLKAHSIGDMEVDLLLSGTARRLLQRCRIGGKRLQSVHFDVDDFWEEVVLSETVYDETDFDMSYLSKGNSI